ncbi:MAG: molybdenum cofactor biosynthesis protein MoaE [Planctomycetota bacterium]
MAAAQTTRETPSLIRLVDGPVGTSNRPSLKMSVPCGAVMTFHGMVRPSEEGEMIDGLEYQVYEPMTTRELRRLVNRQQAKHGVVAVSVEHSFGFVPNGHCSFVLQVASPHRAEAISFADEFISEMKKQVPIWKVPRLATPSEDS